MPIDTMNKFLVAAGGKSIMIMKPSAILSPDDALLLAAWLVAMAEHSAANSFEEVLKAVQGV